MEKRGEGREGRRVKEEGRVKEEKVEGRVKEEKEEEGVKEG